MRRIHSFLLLGLLVAPVAHAAPACGDAATPQPLSARPAALVPVTGEFATGSSQLGAPRGTLAQGFDEAQSVDQVLLRLRVDKCNDVALLPASDEAKTNDPTAYKPKTKHDNTPYRFSMTQNGKRMTADDFDAWLKANGYSVGKRVDPVAAQAEKPAEQPAEAPAEKKSRKSGKKK